MNSDIEHLIEVLGLEPHPEGGFFRETYRSEEELSAAVLPERYGGSRSFGSAILYLLTPDTFSMIHRLATDEIFHFYLGDPVTMLRLFPDGGGDIVTLGSDIAGGHLVQCVAPRGCWMGSSLAQGGRYSLMGTTMAPAFEYTDFSVGDRSELIALYPEFAEEIVRLTSV